MTHKLVSLATFSILMSACGSASTVARVSTPDEPVESSASESDSEELAVDRDRIEDAAARLDQRRVGDLFVHRYSGSYRTEPVVLTEEVVERDGELLVIDYTLEDGKRTDKLRVRFDPDKNRPVRVSRLNGGAEVEAELSDYEAMMAETVFSPDYNEGRIERERETCLVGSEERDCLTTRYHVYMGDQPGTLVVTTSPGLGNHDVGGSVQGENGDILYRSELVEMRRGKPEPAVGPRNAALRFVPSGL